MQLFLIIRPFSALHPHYLVELKGHSHQSHGVRRRKRNGLPDPSVKEAARIYNGEAL